MSCTATLTSIRTFPPPTARKLFDSIHPYAYRSFFFPAITPPPENTRLLQNDSATCPTFLSFLLSSPTHETDLMQRYVASYCREHPASCNFSDLIHCSDRIYCLLHCNFRSKQLINYIQFLHCSVYHPELHPSHNRIHFCNQCRIEHQKHQKYHTPYYRYERHHD